jgi:ATP phosphoribosyltransferase
LALGKVLIKFNISEKKLENIIKILPAMKAPTISQLSQKDYFSVETVVAKSKINILIPKLKNKGAEDIIELPISKIVR